MNRLRGPLALMMIGGALSAGNLLASGSGDVDDLTAPTGRLIEADPVIENAVKGEMLVKMRPGFEISNLHQRAGERGARVGHEVAPGLHMVYLEDGADPIEASRLMMKDHWVEYAEPNFIAKAFGKGGKPGGGGTATPPNDPYYSQQWGLQWMGGPGTGTKSVAVIDTGVNSGCADFAGTTWLAGYDFVNRDSNPADDNNHGTWCASVIAATTNNSTGMAGMSYGARMMAVKVLDGRGSGGYDAVISGIRYAADKGVNVLNLSLGGPYSSALCDAVSYAKSKGCTIVCAAGNDGASQVSYPAGCTGAASVGAIDSNGNVAWFSNGGTRVNYLAPGVQILMMGKSCGFSKADGTSFAAPHIAGKLAR